jgi:DNA invertase Pin-like site-specific DNA recombinase
MGQKASKQTEQRARIGRPLDDGRMSMMSPVPRGMVVDGYVRVSVVGGREGPSFISPKVQREQIEAWARLSGARIGEVFVELNESGGRSDRPLLLSALERIDDGTSHGIVVAKLDRFGRSLIDGLSKIERIMDAGGIFVSVQDGLDISTPTGKLVLRIMLSMAEWELERIGASWALARREAVDRGVYIAPYVPFGYRRGAHGRLRPDPEAAPLVVRIFTERAAGATHREAAATLNESGLPTARGSTHFTESTVFRLFKNRAYLGESRTKDYVNPAAHPPLVDPATWQRAQRPNRPANLIRSSFLGGILRCASCRMKMSSSHGARSGHMVRPSYTCRRYSSAGECPAPARVRADEIEGLFEELCLRLARRRPDRRLAGRIRKAESNLAAAEKSLLAYRDDTAANSALGSERFAEGLVKRNAEVERRALLLADTRLKATATGVPEDLEVRWPELRFEERREMLETLLDCAFVTAGSEPARERVHILARGEEPSGSPGRGHPLGRIVPFEPTSTHTIALPRPALWSERRIERELLAWRGEESVWPDYAEFLRDGRAGLYLQVLEWGGHIYWSHKLGWEVPHLRRHAWSEDRVRGALRPYLRGRETFPTIKEFEQLGGVAIRWAAKSHGGIGFWARDFGVGYQKRSRPVAGLPDSRPGADRSDHRPPPTTAAAGTSACGPAAPAPGQAWASTTKESKTITQTIDP